jgi:hypothetical protein
MNCNDFHIEKKVPIFLKAQSIIELSENYPVEEILAVEKELEQCSNQISTLRSKLHKLAYDKWTKETLSQKKNTRI